MCKDGADQFHHGKATNRIRSVTSFSAITANQPCHAKEIGNNIILSYNVGTTLALPGFSGVCLSWFLSLEKIACRMKDSSLTKCVNESSTASLCYNNTIYIDHEKNPDGTYTTFVTVPKEQIDEWSPVYVTVHLKGTSTDPKCYHNGSASEIASNQTYLTEKPTSKWSPAGTAENSTVTSSLKPVPDVGATTNSTLTPSLKPDPDADTPTNYSTMTPSLKPHPNAGKRGQIVGTVAPAIVVVLIALSYCWYKQRAKENRIKEQSCNLSTFDGNQENSGV